MDIDMLLLYTVVAFFYVISPGPAVFLAISNCLSHNLKAVAYSSTGNIAGLFLLSSVSMLGLGALLMTSASLFLAVKIIGALYLLYLGIKQIRLAGKSKMTADGQQHMPEKSMPKYFQEGFVLASTNPKPILFFTALFPQFLQLDANVSLQFFQHDRHLYAALVRLADELRDDFQTRQKRLDQRPAHGLVSPYYRWPVYWYECRFITIEKQ